MGLEETVTSLSPCATWAETLQDGQFDVVYCISVLEHTSDYAEIIESFQRVLRPGGRLVITFDVSLDGSRDISVERGINLLKSLMARYDVAEDVLPDLNAQVSMPDVFTTVRAKDIAPGLLPWKAPSLAYRLKSLITRGRWKSWPPPLTVFCLSLTKRPIS
jgi:SAM-dependent methyltransferase